MNASIHPMYINGEWRPGSEGAFAEDVNPATGAVFARVAQASARDVEDALAAAHGARHDWQKMLANEREALLHRAAEIIAARADSIRDLIVKETGSVLMKAPWEVSYAVECLRVAAGCIRQPHGDTFPASAAGQIGMTIRQPLGVIAGIAPFNSPFLLAMKKVAFSRVKAITPAIDRTLWLRRLPVTTTFREILSGQGTGSTIIRPAVWTSPLNSPSSVFS